MSVQLNLHSSNKGFLRLLPAVHKILEHPKALALQERFGRDGVVDAAREVLTEVRALLVSDCADQSQLSDILVELRTGLTNGSDETQCLERVIRSIAARLALYDTSGVRRAINATGVILHTGLGRAVLPEAALKDIVRELSGYSTVEIDTESGKRGQRDATSCGLLKTLLGCEHATLVNNNAAATMLSLAALARGKEVIVSRGQLVEIGGSFRVPDVMLQSGCKLVEVGTTNRTYARDFEAAITPETAALMLVHTSNFRMVGFTAEPSVAELAKVARKHKIPLIYDIGSGALLPGLAEELQNEPVVRTALEEGADLVLFSADKIMGSAQGGIAAGRFELVEKMRRHPLYRAFRIDKLTLRVLETSLRIYLDPLRRQEEIPTLKMLRKPLAQIAVEATELSKRLAQLAPKLQVDCADDSSRLGSGSLPERSIPTRVLRLRHLTLSAEFIAAKLRAHQPPIFTRIHEDRVLLDPRTLQAGEAVEIEKAIVHIFGK